MVIGCTRHQRCSKWCASIGCKHITATILPCSGWYECLSHSLNTAFMLYCLANDWGPFGGICFSISHVTVNMAQLSIQQYPIGKKVGIGYFCYSCQSYWVWFYCIIATRGVWFSCLLTTQSWVYEIGRCFNAFEDVIKEFKKGSKHKQHRRLPLYPEIKKKERLYYEYKDFKKRNKS